MGMYRVYTRCRMVNVLKCIYHQPYLLCAVLGTFLIALSYMNNRLNLSFSYWRSFPEKSMIFQEQLRLPHKHAFRFETHKKCEIFTLQNNSIKAQNEKLHKSACQRVPPLPGSCSLADEIFFSEPQTTCSHQSAFNVCELKMADNEKWEIICNETIAAACSSPLSIGRINKHTGDLMWEETGTPLQTSKMLTTYIQRSDRTDMSKLYGFCFIRCLSKYVIPNKRSENFYDYENDQHHSHEGERVYAEQLIVLPPQIKSTDSEMKRSPELFSINIILVDSVSHQHFFRSLPKSVSALKEIITSSGSGTTVLDFELVQAVRSRTFETLQTIFSGDIDPSEKPFGTQEIPPQPLNLLFLYRKFKKKHFHTLWVEDLCYLWEWGISKDLHFLNKSSSSKNTWHRMWNKLSENFVDSVEITLAMCKVLKENKVADHFHGPESVCFNGKHQHEYLLEYIQLYQHVLESRNEPYFAFTMTNVGHEGSGRRIQTLDNSLAHYFKFSASLQNSLTIVFSDHGNSYGQFMHATQEARIELFHPFMMFIIPKNVAKILGNEAIESLRINTLRLVSFLDLHYTLNDIIDPNSLSRHVKEEFRVSHKGLLKPVNASRTCDDIPRIMPNLCICLNYDMPVDNNTDSILFAYFAIGRLNDEIQRQLLVSQIESAVPTSLDETTAFKKCEKLVLMSVQNVRRSFGQDGTQTLKMDLHVQQSEVFFVAFSIKHNYHGQGDHKTELEMYDRITPYSKFSVCADKIDLSLCICDISQNSFFKFSILQEKDLRNMHLLPNFEMIVQNIDVTDKCLYLLTIKHPLGGVIYSANSCFGKSFILNVALEVEDKILYYQPPKLPVVLPGGLVVLGVLYTQTGDSWTSSIKVSYQVVINLSDLRMGLS